jgi:hypothetical protein
MLRDPVEIEIASRAQQPGIRDPNRPREHFDHIFDDFLRGDVIAARDLIDLGPGQWDFAELARERGVGSVTGIDRDEAVVELGHYKGFRPLLGDLRELDPGELGTFDGVFCKFSLNAFWAATDDEAVAYVGRIGELVRPGGWSWIAPWNGAPAELPQDAIDRRLAAQRSAFREHGFDAYELPVELARRYGVTGRVANHPLFVRELPGPPAAA